MLYNTPDHNGLRRWGTLLGLNDHPEFTAMIENPHESTLVRDICLGVVSEQEMWNRMAERWHIKPRMINSLRRRMNSKKRLNSPMINFLSKLQSHYQTAILSNAGNESRRLMEDSLNLDQYVEKIIISAEIRMVKPDPKIYQLVLDKLGTSPEVTLFIDDLEENVIAARDLGMHAIQHRSNDETIRAVEKILARKEF